jgi:hypothetical protein
VTLVTGGRPEGHRVRSSPYDRRVRAFDPERVPQELEPARVNAKAIFVAGTVGWLVALLAVGVLHLLGQHPDGRIALMSAAGLGLGALGYGWAHLVHAGRLSS